MIFRPPSKIENVKDPIFFAGPCPLTGTKYAESYNWREDMMALLRKEGFTGDFIDPTNPNFDSSDFAKQVRWEWEGLRIASAIVFWIPRSKEHPALTTNIEFGEWFDNLNTFVGFPEDSINNEYIEQRCKMIGKSVYRTM